MAKNPAQAALVPMRPCSLCGFFILTGADPDGLAPYAHCDRPEFEREIFPGGDVLRCRGFQFRTYQAGQNTPKAPTGRSGFGIGALITTDAKSQFETNSSENSMRDALRGVA